MSTYSNRLVSPGRVLSKINPGTVFGLIIVTALLGFEMFNYSTTDFALRDLLGELTFAGLRWSTILAIAFCGIDFAGIARLFTPERGSDEPKEVWYLFGAWLLAATMNAILTWWGVSMAIVNHQMQSAAIMDDKTLVKVVPVFVALMVWVIRILIIGTISVAGERFVWGQARTGQSRGDRPAVRPGSSAPIVIPRPSLGGRSVPQRPSLSSRPADSAPAARGEPTYHSLSMTARPAQRPPSTSDSNSNRRTQ